MLGLLSESLQKIIFDMKTTKVEWFSLGGTFPTKTQGHRWSWQCDTLAVLNTDNTVIENVLNRKDLILWKTKDRLKGVVCQHDNDCCGELYSLCHWSLGSEEMVSLWAKSSLHTGAGMTKFKGASFTGCQGLHTSTEWRTFQYFSKYLEFTQCARALAQESFLTSLFETYI